MSDFIFEITDKTGRKIHLTKERWSHIATKHPDISDKIEDLKKALINPSLIVQHKYDDTMRNYYLYNKEEKCYLQVVVKYLNGIGFIASSFFTRKIIRR